MIRPAKFVDTMRIVELLRDMHRASKYREIDEVDTKEAHRLISQCIQRSGHTHAGGTIVLVAVRDQRVEGFVVGMLDNLYHIGKKLMASDVFLYCSPKAHAGDFLKLLRGYIDWAANNPKVVEIRLSWTDALPDAERIEAVYERLGFVKCGGIFSRASVATVVAEAA